MTINCLSFQNSEVKIMPKFEREVEIDVPIEKVWQVLIDPQYWPQWFPGVDSVSTVQTVSLTTAKSVQFTEQDETGTATFVTLQQPDLLEIVTQVGNDKDQHVFKLKKTGGLFGMAGDETKVEYTMDTLSGKGIITKFFATGNPIDSAKVSKAILKFRRLVEKMF